jgi:hypothetical protein
MSKKVKIEGFSSPNVYNLAYIIEKFVKVEEITEVVNVQYQTSGESHTALLVYYK